MKKIKILHIFNDPKFSEGFFNFLLENNVSLEDHFLFHIRCESGSSNNYGMPAIFSPGFFTLIPNLKMIWPLMNSDKVIIHSLASPYLLFYLFLFPHLTKKCYWVIWGKDLYFFQEKKRFHHHIYEFFRRRVIKNIRHAITFNEGDYELAQRWYDSRATLHKSFMYPSNLFRQLEDSEPGDKTVILVGNSGDPSNMHEDAFRIIAAIDNENIELIVPLTYGEPAYIQHILKLGKAMFGEQFVPLTTFVPFDTYRRTLSKVDIAIFAHNRQQAMGHIITLVGNCKKVYLREEVTTFDSLKQLGLKLFKLEDLNFELLDKDTAASNSKIVRKIFSEENLVRQWQEIAEDTP